MRVQPSLPAYGRPLQDAAVPEDLLETIIRAVAEAVVRTPAGPRETAGPAKIIGRTCPRCWPRSKSRTCWASRGTRSTAWSRTASCRASCCAREDRQRMVARAEELRPELIADLNSGRADLAARLRRQVAGRGGQRDGGRRGA